MNGVIAVVQARMGSSRFPGKMLAVIDGRPLLDYVLARLTAECGPGKLLEDVVLASSICPENDRLAEHVARQWPHVRLIRGSENDVLSRYAESVRRTGARIVVRVTGDCPLVNIRGIRQMLAAKEESGADVVNYRPGYEYVDKGAEVVSARALLQLDDDPKLSAQDREHVTSALYRHTGGYQVRYIDSDPPLRRADLRLTIDTEADLRFFRALAAEIPGSLIDASLPEVLEVLERHPELAEINAGSGRKSSLHESVRIGLRCDGGAELGMGHVVGSLRLARLLSDSLGWGAEFVIRTDTTVRAAIQGKGFVVEQLPEDISPEDDVTRLLEKARESDWSFVVINFGKGDLHRYEGQFSRFRHAGVKLVFMDNPIAPMCYEADLLINALPHPDYPDYQPEKHPHCLDGLEYFLPAESLWSVPMGRRKRVHARVERVLIAMGGGNVEDLTIRVLEGLEWSGFRGYVDVVLGNGSSGSVVRSALDSLKLDGWVSANVDNMPERIESADIGFTGLGLTTYEMAYQGLPALIVANSRFNGSVARTYVSRYKGALLVGSWPEVTREQIGASFIKARDSYGWLVNHSTWPIGSMTGDVVRETQKLIESRGGV